LRREDYYIPTLSLMSYILYITTKHYSVILIMLRFILALLQNALTLLGNVIACIIYRSRHIDANIDSYSYCSKLIDQRDCFYSLSLFCYYVPVFQFANSFK
jgi:hypothetical protein